MRVTPGRLALGLAVIVAAVAVGLVIAVLAFGRSGRICSGVTVSGVSLGGLTRDEAAAKLTDWAGRSLRQPITFTALDRRWIGAPADFGARVDVSETVKRVFAIGREGNMFDRAICSLTSGGSGKRVDAHILVNEHQVRKMVDKIAGAVNRPHKDARLKVVDGTLQTEQDVAGIKLNRAEAAKQVSRALAAGTAVVALAVEVDPPDVKAADLSTINTLLARFTTQFNPGKRDRTHNLTLAAREIDGVVLKPGQEFSYNGIVGQRLGERGYREAPIFVRGRMEPGLGGGCCQVSTTVYNAVLLAGLKVISRSPHSRTVPYVVPGRDATVAYGTRDLKFENSNSSPIALLTRIVGSHLTVDIYGSAGDKKNIAIFTSKPVYSSVAGQAVTTDSSLRPGVRKVVDKGSRGVSVTVYRRITLPDGTSEPQVVSRDRYPSQKRIVAVGPSARAVEEPAVLPVNASNSVVGEPGIQSD